MVIMLMAVRLVQEKKCRKIKIDFRVDNPLGRIDFHHLITKRQLKNKKQIDVILISYDMT